MPITGGLPFVELRTEEEDFLAQTELRCLAAQFRFEPPLAPACNGEYPRIRTLPRGRHFLHARPRRQQVRESFLGMDPSQVEKDLSARRER